jgi:epoxyqueuosine reductase QueG
VADEPADIGVEDFCKICRKCANTCPTNSIPFGDKVVFNGIEKYKINWLTCYKLRPYVHDHWGSCLTCAAVCPFTKPERLVAQSGDLGATHLPLFRAACFSQRAEVDRR